MREEVIIRLSDSLATSYAAKLSLTSAILSVRVAVEVESLPSPRVITVVVPTRTGVTGDPLAGAVEGCRSHRAATHTRDHHRIATAAKKNYARGSGRGDFFLLQRLSAEINSTPVPSAIFVAENNRGLSPIGPTLRASTGMRWEA